MYSRIAIVTLYDNLNIGNKLQNYAVQQLCGRYAREVKTLTYREVLKEIGWKGKLAALLGVPRKKAQEKRLLIERKAYFQRFTEKWLNVDAPRTFAAYTSAFSKEYDMFVTGSDQVWHNWTQTDAEKDYFFLSFAPKEKRVCISPSFGFDALEDAEVEAYKRGLQGFQYLSCREQSGCDLIQHLTGQNSELLVDPTMALTVEQWDQIAKKPEYTLPRKYVLAYFLGGISEPIKQYLDHMCIDNGWELIDILDMDRKEWFLTTPDEFLYLIKNATFVATNSFHGSVFSIIYHKNFSVFSRTDSVASTMGSRIATLLNHFKLQSRWMYFGDPNTQIDYESVELELVKQREKVFCYLEKVFNGNIQ